MKETGKPASAPWQYAGLCIALLGIPLVVALSGWLAPVRTPGSVLARELSIFLLAVVLLWIVHRGERLAFASIGMAPQRVPAMAGWTALSLLGLGIAIVAGMGLIQALGLRFGGSSATPLPTWATLLVVLRAGVVEEIFYRGFAMSRIETISGSRMLAFALPLLAFAGFHWKQGPGGVVLALLMGAVLAAVFQRTRRLWPCILAHLLVDLVPNVLIPLLQD